MNNIDTITILKNTQQKANVNQTIKLTQSAILDSPILIRNQEICLPEKAILKMDDEQLEAMVAHELAHIARKDHYWSCGLALLEIVFFFQPLLYWVKREINNSNELLCDAWAAQVTGNNLAVAQCLVTVATWIKDKPVNRSSNYAFVAGMSLNKSELTNRVESLVQFSDGKKSRFNKVKIGFLYTLLFAIMVLVLPAFSFTKIMESTIKVIEPKPFVLENAIEKLPLTISKEAGVTNVEESSYFKIMKAEEETPSWHHLTAQKFAELSPRKKQCAYLLAAVNENDLTKAKKQLATTNPNCLFCGSVSSSSPINAAAQNNNIQMVQLLIDSGADLYTKGHSDEGALIATARNGNVKLMQLLSKYGAYFNYEFEDGTVLSNAIQHNQYNMVKYLLNNNADPMLRLSNGKTAMDYAKAKGGKIWELFSEFN